MAEKFGRRKVRIDPRLSVPPGIVDVEYDTDKIITPPNSGSANNGYDDGISRDDSGQGSNPIENVPGSSNGITARLVKQELVINSLGELVVEVTFEVPELSDARITRI